MNQGVISSGLLLFTVAAPLPALAQDPAATSSAAVQSEQAAGDIIVTAQKKSERLLDVPMSVNVIGGDQIAGNSVNSTRDLQLAVPGLNAVSLGLSFQPVLRGVASTGTTPGDENNIATYLDDVYLPSPFAGVFDLGDIERVEVLKGPQGTLYGRNSTGGAIKIVTRDPSLDKAQLKLDYSHGFEFAENRVSGFGSVPLGSGVAASFSGVFVKSAGYITNIAPQHFGEPLGGHVSHAIRAKVLIRPTDNLKITLAGDEGKNSDNSVFVLVPVGGNASAAANPAAVLPTGRNQASLSTVPVVRSESRGVSANIGLDLPAFTLKSITAYRHAEGLFITDSDRSNLPAGNAVFGADANSFSQELNFSGKLGPAIDWLTGAYYFRQTSSFPFFNGFSDDSGTKGTQFRTTSRTSAISGFADVTFNPSDRWTFIAGGRYSSERRSFDYADTFRPGGASLRTLSAARTSDRFTWRAIARYNLSARSNIYASVNTGFKSAIFNTQVVPLQQADPEKITAYELGVKAALSRQFSLTAAVFHYDYSNMQVQQTTQIAGVVTTTLSNASSAKITGVDADFVYQPVPGLRIQGGASWLPTARYDNYTGAQIFLRKASGLGNDLVAPFDASGSRLIRTPRLQVTGSVTWTRPIADGELAASLAASYNDGFYWQPGNLTPEKPFTLLNARLGYRMANGLSLSVYAENLADADYSIYTNPSTAGTHRTFARPRQIGISLGFDLGPARR